MQKFFIVVLIISLGAIASCGKKDAAVPPSSTTSTFFPTVTP